jgi:hypothetical protein
MLAMLVSGVTSMTRGDAALSKLAKLNLSCMAFTAVKSFGPAEILVV